MAGHVRKLGPKSYQARWLDPSNRERSKVFAKKSDADKHLISVQNSILVGDYVDPKAARATVGMMADQWLASKVSLKPTTRALYVLILEKHVRPRWQDVPLSRVDYASIQAWVGSLVSSGLGASHVRDIYGVLSGILSLAVRGKRLSANPATDIELPTRKLQPRKYLTAAQVAILATEAAALPSGRPKRATDAAFDQYRLVILTLGYCGLRWGEMAGLRVRNVDLMKRRFLIENAVTEIAGQVVWGTPKTHERRSVPIPKFLADALMLHLAGKRPDDLVFTAPGGGVLRNRNARRAWFTRAAKAIGQEGLTPHELRHTAASLAVSVGANVKAVQRMLGHASAVMTLDRYADLFDDDLDGVGDRLDALAEQARIADHDEGGIIRRIHD